MRGDRVLNVLIAKECAPIIYSVDFYPIANRKHQIRMENGVR